MSLEAEIFTAVKAIFQGQDGSYRFFPVAFPQDPVIPVVPAGRYTFISNAPVTDICGDDGGRTADVRVQIDVLDKTFSGARALRQRVIDAMEAISTPTILDGGFDDYDADLKLYRCSIDFITYPSS